tara:strand:- start:380 stop:1078 length:699 start_codon:yes stop_codon:yes gene_type:complete
LILCGGLGTRLESISQGKPKILMPINGKPFIEIQFNHLYKNGIRKFVYLLGHKSQEVNAAIENIKIHHKDADIQIVFEGKNRLGTGGAVHLGSKHINDELFLVTYGDNFLRLNYKDFEDKCKISSKSITMTLYKNKNFIENSNIEFDEINQKILKYSKNYSHKMEYIDFGIICFSKKIFENNSNQKPYDLKQHIKDAIKTEDIDSYIVDDRFYEIGTPESYKEFCEFYRCYV